MWLNVLIRRRMKEKVAGAEFRPVATLKNRMHRPWQWTPAYSVPRKGRANVGPHCQLRNSGMESCSESSAN